jgi:LacI family transcriptional regulator
MGVTIKDIAKEANVSVTTVSRVLNGKPDVSEETKNKIQRIIRIMGYQPNGIARGLVLQKTYTIGLIIPDISNPFFPEVARGIEDKAKETGYSVIFCNTDNHSEWERDSINLLKSKQVDGIILSLSMANSGILKQLEKEGFPVVQIDRLVSDSNYPAVIVDNVLSAFNAVNYLIKQGHTRIAHLTGALSTRTGQDRLEGYKKALLENGIGFNEKWILEGDYSKEAGYLQAKCLLKQADRPTALFAANDLMAIGAYEAIYDQGLSIPDEISIVGHDDIDIASLVRPGLTTMRQPKYKIGQRAAQILINMVEKSEILTGKKVILQTELVERNSSRAW